MLLLLIVGVVFVAIGLMTIVGWQMERDRDELPWAVFWVSLELFVGFGLILRGVTLW
jgi:hypothetical protein